MNKSSFSGDMRLFAAASPKIRMHQMTVPWAAGSCSVCYILCGTGVLCDLAATWRSAGPGTLRGGRVDGCSLDLVPNGPAPRISST